MKRIIAMAAVATVAAFGATLAIGSPASAALPTCSRTVTGWTPAGETTIPAASSGSTDCVMGKGAQSSAVRALQSALNCYRDAEIHINIGVDGIFGTQTYSALLSVQGYEGIGRDGVYGPQTREHILWPIPGFGCYYLG